MSSLAVIVVIVTVLVLLFFAGASVEADAPPATRRQLERADRIRRADLTAAIERDSARPQTAAYYPAPPVVIVFVKGANSADDPRRWN